MDWVSLFLNFLGDIAWPVVVLVVALVFKSQLAELLGRVTKLTTPLGSFDAKVKDIAIEVVEVGEATARHAELEAAAETAERSPEEAGSAETESADEHMQRERHLRELRAHVRGMSSGTPLDTPILWGEFDAAARLVEASPADAVREAWKVFWSEVWNLALDQREHTAGEVWDITSQPAAVTLAQLGVRTELIRLAIELDIVRHGTSGVTPQGAAHYVQAASQLLSVLRYEVTGKLIAPRQV